MKEENTIKARFGLLIGIGVGIAIGTGTDNTAAGIAIGVALALIFSRDWDVKKGDNEEE